MKEKELRQPFRFRFKRPIHTGVSAAVIMILLAGCYMQTASEATGDLHGDLHIQATLPADFSITPASGNGEIGALNVSGVPFVFAMVVDVDVFTEYRLQLEDFYNTLLLNAVFEAGIYSVDSREQLAGPDWLDITLPAESVLNTNFGSGVRSVAQEIADTTSGNVSFPDLPGGRHYPVIVEIYDPLSVEAGPGDYNRIVDASLSSVTAGGSSSVSLNLQQDLGILYDFMVNQVDVPVFAVLAGGGTVDYAIDSDGNLYFDNYSVGGFAFEYRKRIASGRHLHHVYIFEPGMQFNIGGSYSKNTLGAGRLSAVAAEGNAFMELLIETDSLLFESWSPSPPTVNSRELARAWLFHNGLNNWVAESAVEFNDGDGIEPIFVAEVLPAELYFLFAENETTSTVYICDQPYDPSDTLSTCPPEEGVD